MRNNRHVSRVLNVHRLVQTPKCALNITRSNVNWDYKKLTCYNNSDHWLIVKSFIFYDSKQNTSVFWTVGRKKISYLKLSAWCGILVLAGKLLIDMKWKRYLQALSKHLLFLIMTHMQSCNSSVIAGRHINAIHVIVWGDSIMENNEMALIAEGPIECIYISSTLKTCCRGGSRGALLIEQFSLAKEKSVITISMGIKSKWWTTMASVILVLWGF